MRMPGPITGIFFGVALGLYAAALVVIALADSHDTHIGSLLGFVGSLVSLIACVTNIWERDRRANQARVSQLPPWAKYFR